MNLVNRRPFRKNRNNCKVFKRAFTVVLCISLFCEIMYFDRIIISESANGEVGKQRVEVQSVDLPIVSTPAPQDNIVNELKNTETEVEVSTETLETEVEEVVITVKPNKMYCVVENGWTSTPKAEYLDYLWAMCEKYNVTEHYELFVAQMYHESTFRPNLISGTNDYGLFQINKQNHQWLGDILGNYDFLDPYNNIEAGVYLMSHFLSKYKDVQKALVCYNKGESAVRKGIYSTEYSRGVLYDMTLLVEI